MGLDAGTGRGNGFDAWASRESRFMSTVAGTKGGNRFMCTNTGTCRFICNNAGN